MKKMGKKFLIGTAFAISAATMVACGPEVAVYGPPEDFEVSTGEDVTYVDEAIDVTEEVNVDVYGPPAENFEEDTEVNVLVYGPPAED